MTSTNKLAKARKIAAPIITKYEGFKANAYKDPVGIWTIGYGHTGSAAYQGNIITPGQAQTLLNADMAEAQKPLKIFADDLDPYQLAALTSFIFNVGGGAFLRSTLRRKLAAGDTEGAADEFLRWDKATKPNGEKVTLRGLTIRRAHERDVFLNGLKKKGL